MVAPAARASRPQAIQTDWRAAYAGNGRTVSCPGGSVAERTRAHPVASSRRVHPSVSLLRLFQKRLMRYHTGQPPPGRPAAGAGAAPVPAGSGPTGSEGRGDPWRRASQVSSTDLATRAAMVPPVT